VPLFSPPTQKKKKLGRRKGGGGKGGGGFGGGKGGGSSSGGGTKGSVPISGSSGKSSATSYGGGGGKVTTIPSGSLFSGRTQGGGTRQEVFGNQRYGSGYPGATGLGVSGRGFPFFFWPVVWGGAGGYAAGSYIHNNEYGNSNNDSRPGGPLFQTAFASNVTSDTYHLIADNSTVLSLRDSIQANCSSYINPASFSTAPIAVNDSSPTSPQPEQAIQYYRASSVVLTLDGYNDTSAISNDTSIPDTPLPTNLEPNLLECLNQTIGLAVPLIDGADSRWAAPGMGIMGMVWVVLCLLHQL